MNQISDDLSFEYGYVVELKELNRGIVYVTLEPKDENFILKEAEWQSEKSPLSPAIAGLNFYYI